MTSAAVQTDSCFEQRKRKERRKHWEARTHNQIQVATANETDVKRNKWMENDYSVVKRKTKSVVSKSKQRFFVVRNHLWFIKQVKIRVQNAVSTAYAKFMFIYNLCHDFFFHCFFFAPCFIVLFSRLYIINNIGNWCWCSTYYCTGAASFAHFNNIHARKE